MFRIAVFQRGCDLEIPSTPECPATGRNSDASPACKFTIRNIALFVLVTIHRFLKKRGIADDEDSVRPSEHALDGCKDGIQGKNGGNLIASEKREIEDLERCDNWPRTLLLSYQMTPASRATR